MKKLILCLVFVMTTGTMIHANSNEYTNHKKLNSTIDLSNLTLTDNFNLESYNKTNFISYNTEDYNIICTIIASAVADLLEEYTDLSEGAIDAVEKAVKEVCEDLI